MPETRIKDRPIFPPKPVLPKNPLKWGGTGSCREIALGSVIVISLVAAACVGLNYLASRLPIFSR